MQWYNLFCHRGLGHDTRVTQSLHFILPCGALYKLDPLETKGLYLVRFSKGCVLKHFSVAVVEWSYTIKLRATHITLLVNILFCPSRLGHDTQVTQLSHSILPCGALYKLDTLETKGLNLVRFSKGCVHKHFSVAVVEWSYAITWSHTHTHTHTQIFIICKLLKIVAVYNMKCKEYINTA